MIKILLIVLLIVLFSFGRIFVCVCSGKSSGERQIERRPELDPRGAYHGALPVFIRAFRAARTTHYRLQLQ
jgi:hypothetical protein